MNNDKITYEPGTFRTPALDFRLVLSGVNVHIEHRRHNSQWWDITKQTPTQKLWESIKKEGVKIG